MQKNKILLWDEIDHGKGFPWPNPTVLPKKYITRPPTLASLPVWVAAGAVTPLGLNIEEYWRGLKCGRSAIGPITRFDTSKYPVKVAAEKPFVEVLSDFSKIQ